MIHIILNILPLPIWLGYYLCTISDRVLFMMPADETVCMIIAVGFTVYNLFSRKVFRFAVRNIISSLSLTVGCYICGPLYLTMCSHMSDEHYAVKSIPQDIASNLFLLTGIACVIRFVITKKKGFRYLNGK